VANSAGVGEGLGGRLKEGQRYLSVDANAIASEVLGRAITNTTMIGALVKATGVVELGSFEEPLRERFGRLAERNFQAMKRAYESL